MSWRARAKLLLLVAAAAVLASYYGTALLERVLPHPWLRRFQRSFGNPGGRLMSGLPGWALLETNGRRTGEPRQVPVGGRLIADNFWLVAVDPDHAGYVKNIEANPKTRVKIDGRWRDGVAHLLPDDNPRRRMFQLNPINGLFITIAGRDHLTIRIQLDPPAAARLAF